jgi:hypothetical protein
MIVLKDVVSKLKTKVTGWPKEVEVQVLTQSFLVVGMINVT